MTKDKKLFTIDEDTAKEVSNMLQGFIEHIDEDCSRSGCMCDLRGDVCSQCICDVLHHFDSGLCLTAPLRKESPKKK